jgi:hypothetical protein
MQDPRRVAWTTLIGADIRETDAGAEELPPSIGSVAPKLAMWILLLIGGVLYRFCN